METKNARLLMLGLIFSGFSFGISAQNSLDALIKKCETHKSVDMEVVKNKRKTDKGVETKTVHIRITNDKKLVNEFLDAFRKDAGDAEQAMFKKGKENKEINYYQCRFSDRTYTMVIKEGGNANVTIGNARGFRFGQFDPFRQPYQQKQREEQRKKRMKQQQKKIKQHLDRIQQYKLKNLDSVFAKHNIIADSLILKSPAYFNSINWDSITSKFGKDIDSLAYKLGVGWDEILERYNSNKD